MTNKFNIEGMSPLEELEKLQELLNDLQTDRASVEIVFDSLKNAYSIHPEVGSDEADKEICRAYDDLMAQVRHLDRSLKRLDKTMKMTEQKVAQTKQLSPS
ncbi:hypothetical protein A0J61_03250 [Choanephora cucurbitarum]|uniref:Uncharacterized protein n=1 Tax=Choanephora cucurbitarum TaxID=101091 RepID=A0A1C7NHU4_9FUNG|nr:hypothetical protein A0J61_03250 [Choanephora cucurbitarum]